MKSKSVINIVVIGLFMSFATGCYTSHHPSVATAGNAFSQKVDLLFRMIDYSYVDSVNMENIEEKAIYAALDQLDPHSTYIPARDMQRANEDIVGNFGGIGIQFYCYQDTVTVVNVVKDGPSEAEGIRPGDRIVSANGRSLIKISSDSVMSNLRGEIGTKVKLSVVRRGEKTPLTKEVSRGSIPVKSVNVAYMINDTTAFIRVSTFGMMTYFEMMAALAQLKEAGMKKLIFDLRDNEGGTLNSAIQMVNEFLPANRLIVYTQGKAHPRQDYSANGKGAFQDIELAVLINDFTASSSEIFAGAIQDNDRGQIIGRRSFGKGLVQEQRLFSDGSAVRLTIARYYSPSGRCIQKSYAEGKEKYYEEIYQRILHGEFTEQDSISFDKSLQFETVGGRTVYGGGGIMPDVFIPADTVGYSNYFADVNVRALYEFSFDFMDRHRAEMSSIKDYKALLKYLNQFDLVDEMATFAEGKPYGIKRDKKGIKESYGVMRNRIEAYIGRHHLDDNGFYPIVNMMDKNIQAALR